ncbi:small GTP-binding protein domain containing protein [Theileria equi strain WA]|uniref:Small GTP-binding protein domain containing protein n=1 Tax=Theileria equi strain WA TaxID=1537102 RepID=L0AUP4_THEEQ|nr:small GTP-binding protein domain containing protein [Theileria equi strain WA]AFZ79342.1 small GTP-binding protein domain containing protein [Theileria equi strain WA]|eukprot:XP_004829008.1 small GTP-binding protein domain containing protein [Theileria equi strain WA]
MNVQLTRDVAKTLSELVSVTNKETFPRYQTPFADYIRIKCQGGHGGSPLENVNRSKKLNGPGYGGHGGNVIFKSTHLVEDLLHLPDYIKAKNGGNAHGTSRGLHARDSVINVPLGLIVRKRIKSGDRTRNVFWHQFLKLNESLLIARGGKGGLGPSCFKKHDNRLPEVGEITNLELELRLFNDVAFLGLPNSGKTSLISSITPYMTRIGPEEGSTTRPHSAVLKFIDGLDIRLLDLPPLHPNDEKLGRILRHIYRSKLIVYVLSASDPTNHMETLQLLRSIVTGSPMFDEDKLELVVMTRCDMLHKDVLFNLDRLHYKLLDALPHIRVVGISSTHGLGLDRLVKTIRNLLYPAELTYNRRHFVESYETKLLPQELKLLAP